MEKMIPITDAIGIGIACGIIFCGLFIFLYVYIIMRGYRKRMAEQEKWLFDYKKDLIDCEVKQRDGEIAELKKTVETLERHCEIHIENQIDRIALVYLRNFPELTADGCYSRARKFHESRYYNDKSRSRNND